MHLAIKNSLNIVSTLVESRILPLLVSKVDFICIFSHNFVIFLPSTLRLSGIFRIASWWLILVLSLMPITHSLIVRVSIQRVADRPLLNLTGPVIISYVLHHIERVHAHSRRTYGVPGLRPSWVIIPSTDSVECSFPVILVMDSIPHWRSAATTGERVQSVCRISVGSHL